MQVVLDKYLLDKNLSWSPQSIRSTRHTLSSLFPYLNGDPLSLWNHLQKIQKPYSRVTTWWRVCAFWDYYQKEQHEKKNPYREFRSQNIRLFKDKYLRKVPSMSIKDARSLIETELSARPDIRNQALILLLTGMRYGEAKTYKDGWVEGKTGSREVFLPILSGPKYEGSYVNFLRQLYNSTRLKPHDLRKIYLNECVNSGANIFEVMKMAGWKNLETARSYINARRDRLVHISNDVIKKSL